MADLSSDLVDVPGLRIGHWTGNATGCTVLRFDVPTLGVADVRGAAPGSRELDALRVGNVAPHPDAILLTGGSAFGLAAADGVMRWMREHDRGFPTPAGPVPIVPAAVIFDLDPAAYRPPHAEAGYAATNAALTLPEVSQGRVGAGTGATFGKIRGGARPGGIGIGQVAHQGGITTAVVVLNAWGDAVETEPDPRIDLIGTSSSPPFGRNTSLIALVTTLPLDQGGLVALTSAAHDALARRIRPVHTLADGDTAFAVTLRPGARDPALAVRGALAAEIATEAAIDSIVSGACDAESAGIG